jgi:cell division protein FtsL
MTIFLPTSAIGPTTLKPIDTDFQKEKETVTLDNATFSRTKATWNTWLNNCESKTSKAVHGTFAALSIVLGFTYLYDLGEMLYTNTLGKRNVRIENEKIDSENADIKKANDAKREANKKIEAENKIASANLTKASRINKAAYTVIVGVVLAAGVFGGPKAVAAFSSTN